jgi:hypothetical protein
VVVVAGSHVVDDTELIRVDEFTYRFNARQTDFTSVFHALISSATDTANLPYKVLTA